MRVLLVNDDSPPPAGAQAVVAEVPGLELMGTAADCHGAQELLQTLGPEVLMLVIAIPVARDATGPVADAPGARVMVLRGSPLTGPLLGQALQGFDVMPDGGDRHRPHAAPAAAHGPEPAVHLLSAREQEVLYLISSGCTYAQVARRLLISENTVRNHVRNAVSRLGVRNRSEAIAVAVRAGLGVPVRARGQVPAAGNPSRGRLGRGQATP